MSALDPDAVERENRYWKPTGKLRWFRPKGCDDTEVVLQQLWERVSGECSWEIVPTCLED